MEEDHKKGKMDPLSIAESLGIKTFRKPSRNLWTPEDDQQLIQFLMKLTGVSKVEDIKADEVEWEVVASGLSKDRTRKTKDFKKRWTTSLDPNLRKGKWTKDEDNLLIEAYEKFGPAWQRVSNYLGTRTTDQCAKRYTEVLDPKTKDRLNPWTREEELLLVRQIGIHGTKWRTVAAHFDNRPALTCRNKWRSIALNVAKGKVEPLIKKEVEKIILSNTNDVVNKDNPSASTGGGPGASLSKSPVNLNSNISSPESSITTSHTPQTSSSNHHTNSNNNGNNSSYNRNQTEWKYNLIPTANSPDNIPSGKFGKSGVISNEEIVNQLCQYAKSYHLNIEVHQHIHHHYAPPPHPFTHVQPSAAPPSDPSLNLNSFNGSFGNNSGYSTTGSSAGSNQQKSYFLEPEAQLNRFQHFNYLPPLTELPKLTSSNSPNATPPQSFNALNSNNNQDKDRNDRREDSPTTLTPLTQAVELAAAEMTKKRKTHDGSSSAKRSKRSTGSMDGAQFNASKSVGEEKTRHKGSSGNKGGSNNEADDDEDDEDIEEGLDFWEQMRNLTDLPQHQLQHQQAQVQAQTPSQVHKPVSQHHPLHYFSGNVTPQPQTAPTPTNNVSTTLNSTTMNNSGAGVNSISSIIGKLKGDDDDLKAYGMFRPFSKSRSSSHFEADLPLNLQQTPQTRSPKEQQSLKGETRPGQDRQTRDVDENDHDNPNYVYEDLLGSFGMMPFNPS